ncbi:hypothetical protein XO10_03505 [Marinitoga sp. 1135]|uniref:DAGKc domain-containing protein n=1 Tax=Marinitoga piezophila (strain DSM 14283 / JCM 11233 / KA3) TaxID=443254 RepID=H2J668_MARPK|nr:MULTISPECIES: diacylglycerol kinase family protein [Marinitoga]AEX85129.1 conserved protein of unknown function BmrU [Marinitoga piezophila KA3]APT75631.1 hypothetical protein LN42_03905 [Marinitoga sp. 1137]NUU95340.1 hypothetical protein [Marinitoga sp. 1135]NUU97274.1 hypothetical protein [Marinitoga sp. 1138]
MKKYYIIVNPHSSGGKAKEKWKVIEKKLKELKIDFEKVFTSRRMHAYSLTIEAIKDGYKRFLIVGGDGTVNEVVNGFFSQEFEKTENLLIGLIPTGTGNDWGKTVGIPVDIYEAIDVLKHEKVYTQDVGFVKYYNDEKEEKRFFVNIAGMFFDAEVTRRTNNSKDKNKSSSFSYLLNLLSSLFKYTSQNAIISYENKSLNKKIFSMAVGICKYSGGGMKMVPEAIPDDGKLDVTIVNDLPKWVVVQKIKKLFDGSFIKEPWVDYFRTEKLSINSQEKIYLEVDGESLGHSPFEFGIIKKALNVLVK